MSISQRPWGTYEILAEADGYKVKRIVVNPGERLSLQSHHHRSELWIVVEGQGVVTLESKQSKVGYNSVVSIPAEMKHRMTNDSSAPLIFIEVQTGDSFEEQDIIRYSDDYGRIKDENR